MTNNMEKLILTIESGDLKTSENAYLEIKRLISKGIGVIQLVEHYAKCQSIRALELLCIIREPYDWLLMDKMMENMSYNRLGTIVLLGKMVEKTPCWLSRLSQHCLFLTILEMIQFNESVEFVSAAILFITSILPYSSAMSDSVLEHLLNSFVQTCRILVMLEAQISDSNKMSTESLVDFSRSNSSGSELVNESQGARMQNDKIYKEKYFMNRIKYNSIKLALLKFFSMLYTLFPKYCIDYLRELFSKNAYSSLQLNVLLCKTVEDLFLTVRLHPGLIFKKNSTNMYSERWKNIEPHEFVALAHKISVDPELNDFFIDYNAEKLFETESTLETNDEALFVKHLPRLLFSGDFDSQPNGTMFNLDGEPLDLHFDLNTPPNGHVSTDCLRDLETSSVKGTNALEKTKKMQTTSLLLNSKVFSMFQNIFKPKEISGASRISNKSLKLDADSQDGQDIQKIEEIIGVCSNENVLSTLPISPGIEIATECIDDFESGSLTNLNEPQNDNLNVDYDQPSTSGLLNQNKEATTADDNIINNSSTKIEMNNQDSPKLITIKNCEEDTQDLKFQKLNKALSLSNLGALHEQSIFSTIPKRPTKSSELITNCWDEKSLNFAEESIPQDTVFGVEKARQKYIQTSAHHHFKLKEMGVSDRFLGVIYDDMYHLLKELPVEKQNEILFTRLRLVNQHLLFERNCRSLHETRNRRLFGKLHHQQTIQVEYENLKMSEHKMYLMTSKKLQMSNDLTQQLYAKHSMILENEKKVINQLKLSSKENEKIMARFELLQNKFDRLANNHKDCQTRIKTSLMQNENLMAEKKILALDIKQIPFLQNEIVRLQNQKLELEKELHSVKKTLKGGLLHQTAEEMVAPFYEGQLKNLRQQLRKTKMSLNQMTDKNQAIESQWKEEINRRLELQSTLERASIAYSKNLEASQHKFNSLLAACNKQEAHIFNLYKALENETSLQKSPLSESKCSDIDKMASLPIPILKARANNDAACTSSSNSPVCRAIACDNSYVFTDTETKNKIADLFAPQGTNLLGNDSAMPTDLMLDNAHKSPPNQPQQYLNEQSTSNYCGNERSNDEHPRNRNCVSSSAVYSFPLNFSIEENIDVLEKYLTKPFDETYGF